MTSHGVPGFSLVTASARHFGKLPDQLGPNELRSYQAYLLQERKVDNDSGTTADGSFPASLAHDGACECALFVAKELAFQ